MDGITIGRMGTHGRQWKVEAKVRCPLCAEPEFLSPGGALVKHLMGATHGLSREKARELGRATSDSARLTQQRIAELRPRQTASRLLELESELDRYRARIRKKGLGPFMQGVLEAARDEVKREIKTLHRTTETTPDPPE